MLAAKNGGILVFALLLVQQRDPKRYGGIKSMISFKERSNLTNRTYNLKNGSRSSFFVFYFSNSVLK